MRTLKGKDKVTVWEYSILFILIVISFFEYFFRNPYLKPAYTIFLIAAFIFQIRKVNRQINYSSAIAVCAVFLLYRVVQMFALGKSGNSLIGDSTIVLNGLFVVLLLRDRFYKIYSTIMYHWAFIGLFIYVVCWCIPSLCSALVDFANNFPSQNSEIAVFGSGGLNFIIYNFQINPLVYDSLWRNSGAFWEPGMFALMINVALFFNFYILKDYSKKKNTILILALISTFSTGGYLGGFVILSGLINRFKSPLIKGLYFILFIVFCGYLYQELEFMQEKIVEQLAEGGDLSRFGAALLHIEMIKRSPIWGGDGGLVVMNQFGVLANGVTNVFVNYGVIIGLFYYIMLFVAVKRQYFQFSQVRQKYIYILYFVFLLVMAFTQTITTTSLYYAIMTLGLIKMRKKKKHGISM